MCLEGWKPLGDPQVGHSQRDLSFATGRRCPLKTMNHVAVAQHAMLNALGHLIHRLLWIRWSSETLSKKAEFTCSETLEVSAELKIFGQLA